MQAERGGGAFVLQLGAAFLDPEQLGLASLEVEAQRSAAFDSSCVPWIGSVARNLGHVGMRQTIPMFISIWFQPSFPLTGVPGRVFEAAS